MGIHDAAHANFEGRASQQAHVILAVRKNVTAQRVSMSILCWSRKKIQRVVRSSLAAETQHGDVHGTAGLDENKVEPDDDGRVFL